MLGKNSERDEHQGDVGQPPGRIVVAVVRPEADSHEVGSEGQGESGDEDSSAYFVSVPHERDSA